MNGFNYNPEKMEITITNDKTIVIWKNVEKEIAEKAGKMFKESISIDNYLQENGCKRFWGNINQA